MTCKTYHVFEQQHRKGAVGHCVGTAMSSFPFPALPAVRWLCAGTLDYRSQQDYFLHGQHWKGNRTQQMRGSLGWESRGVNAAQPELSAKLPGQGMGRAQMLTWPCMQTLLFCHHLTPARWLKRGRVFPYGGPPAFRTVLAVFAALERSQDTNTDAGELCTLVAAGETGPGKSVLGTVPWSLLSLVIFIQGSNALLQ